MIVVRFYSCSLFSGWIDALCKLMYFRNGGCQLRQRIVPALLSKETVFLSCLRWTHKQQPKTGQWFTCPEWWLCKLRSYIPSKLITPLSVRSCGLLKELTLCIFLSSQSVQDLFFVHWGLEWLYCTSAHSATEYTTCLCCSVKQGLRHRLGGGSPFAV